MGVRWRVLIWVAAIPLVAGVLGCSGVACGPGELHNSPGTLSIATSQLPDDETRVHCHVSLTSTGGVSPFAWTAVSGPLPLGLGLAAATRQITGTPTVSGVSSFTVQVNNAAGQTATQAINLTVPSRGASTNILAAGFETAADRACPPVLGDGLSCAKPGTWAAVSDGNPPTPTYYNDPAGAHSGSWYAGMTLRPSPTRQYSAGWFYSIPAAYSASTQMYLEEWLKFPIGWRWRCCGGGNEQKAFILENANSNTNGIRPIVSIQADSTCTNSLEQATCAYICLWSGNNVNYICHNQPGQARGIVADGRWHSLQLSVNVATGHWSLWLDGQLYIDVTDSRLAAGNVVWTTAKYGHYFDMDAAGTDLNYYIDSVGLGRF